MPKIHVLKKQVAELIAAGEVVERPASVVKELMENSIDAGASAVTVEIQHGGVSFLRVTDDGCGVARADVPAAFLRHATSKILTEHDLSAIGTLGFRGEALCSIAAVSRCEMLTRTREELAGTHAVLEGGELRSVEDAGCPEGTTILVRDLFFNTPARMKFLKKDVSEGNAVGAVVEKEALSHPEVSVLFLREGKEELHTPGDGRLLSAVYAVLGRSFAEHVLPVKYEQAGVKVNGYVSEPTAARANRSLQLFFLNGRTISAKTASAALEEAFRTRVMVGRHPACVLELGVDPATVDVNVHPAKLEVRFESEKQVFDAVYYGVKNALTAGEQPPTLQLGRSDAAPAGPKPSYEQQHLPGASGAQARRPEAPAQSGPAGIPENRPAGSAIPGPGTSPSAPDGPAAAALQGCFAAVREPGAELHNPVRLAYEPVQNPAAQRNDSASAEPPDRAPTDAEAAASPEDASGWKEMGRAEIPRPGRPCPPRVVPAQEVRVLGECFHTYILAESGGTLWVIDKHAAHERILYERIKAQGRAAGQMLLSPATVVLSRAEYDAVLSHLPELQSAGFGVEDFGGSSVLLREAPMTVPPAQAGQALQQVAGELAANSRDTTPELVERLYHSVACRSAVKAGDRSEPQELAAIARQVLAREDLRHCPHGRPVAFTLTQADLEKQFGRRG